MSYCLIITTVNCSFFSNRQNVPLEYDGFEAWVSPILQDETSSAAPSVSMQQPVPSPPTSTSPIILDSLPVDSIAPTATTVTQPVTNNGATPLQSSSAVIPVMIACVALRFLMSGAR